MYKKFQWVNILSLKCQWVEKHAAAVTERNASRSMVGLQHELGVGVGVGVGVRWWVGGGVNPGPILDPLLPTDKATNNHAGWRPQRNVLKTDRHYTAD